MAAFKVLLRKTGEVGFEIDVTPETLISEIKAEHGLGGCMLSYKGHRKGTASVADIGIQPRETISVVKTGTSLEQQSALRMKKGQKRATAHSHLNLHTQTQGVILTGMMTECQLLGQKFDAIKNAVERNTKPNPERDALGI